MSQPGERFRLASGGTVRVTRYLVEAESSDGTQPTVVDMQHISGISRQGTEVRIQDRQRNRVVTLRMATLDDAGQLEDFVRNVTAQQAVPQQVSPPGPPPKRNAFTTATGATMGIGTGCVLFFLVVCVLLIALGNS